MNHHRETAASLYTEISIKGAPKRLKIRSLLKLFGYVKRKESNVSHITELLAAKGIVVNPPLIKVNKSWKQDPDSMVVLSLVSENPVAIQPSTATREPMNDAWFDTLSEREFRSEKEVETKFILPLLERLGWSEDDRFDGMTFQAYSGSRATTLEVDCALFDAHNPLLINQVLLVAEAKRERWLTKKTELQNAQRQVKSYAIWLSCHFGLVTDSRVIQVLDLFPSISGMKVLFECSRADLKHRFADLAALISKPCLVKHYERMIGNS